MCFHIFPVLFSEESLIQKIYCFNVVQPFEVLGPSKYCQNDWSCYKGILAMTTQNRQNLASEWIQTTVPEKT